jgi:hypothetical protein
MKDFRSFVKSHPGKSAEALANLLLKQPAALILPVLVREIEEVRRTATLSNERTILAPFLERFLAVDSINGENYDLIIQAFRERVALGDGQRMELLKMTEAEHEYRINFLRLQAVGITETIKLHEQCIRVIRKYKVATMADVLLGRGKSHKRKAAAIA